MRIGIMAEGRDDQRVIEYILKGLGVENVVDIRPSLKTDKTDKNTPNNNTTIGTWQGVKNACLSGEDYDRFFFLEDSDYMVVHLDTAEIEQNEASFVRPDKSDLPAYATELRTQVVALINSWLTNENIARTLHAVSIEEIEAWVLTVLMKTDTTASTNPKQKLQYELRSQKVDDIAQKFRKSKNLKDCRSRNGSLDAFCKAVEVLL